MRFNIYAPPSDQPLISAVEKMVRILQSWTNADAGRMQQSFGISWALYFAVTAERVWVMCVFLVMLSLVCIPPENCRRQRLADVSGKVVLNHWKYHGGFALGLNRIIFLCVVIVPAVFPPIHVLEIQASLFWVLWIYVDCVDVWPRTGGKLQKFFRSLAAGIHAPAPAGVKQ